MNERIKALYKEATGKSFANDFDARVLEAEKFAELIVRECVTKMALEIMNNSWIDDAVKNTYEHFGVEE